MDDGANTPQPEIDLLEQLDQRVKGLVAQVKFITRVRKHMAQRLAEMDDEIRTHDSLAKLLDKRGVAAEQDTLTQQLVSDAIGRISHLLNTEEE